MRSFKCFLVVLAGIATGCGERKADEIDPLPIKAEPHDMIVMIFLDTTLSDADNMQKYGYKFCLHTIDSLFSKRMGSNDKLILCQISGTKKAIFWDGEPKSLRREFADDKAFMKFLLSRPDPGGSRVHDSISDGLEYLLIYPGVKEKKTKVVTVILGDMDDNFPDKEKSKARLLKNLVEYAKVDSCLGIYWCDRDLLVDWTRHLHECGMGTRGVVSAEMVPNPKLPNFQ